MSAYWGHFVGIRSILDSERAVEAKHQQLEEEERALHDQQNKVKEDKRKVEEEKKKVADEKKKVADEKKKVADEKKKKVADEKKKVEERERNAGPPQSVNVHPPDYDAFKFATDSAWPRAVEVILRNRQLENTVKNRQHQLMKEWVAARGDKLPPNAYDYLTYSHGVAWPKAILESTSDDRLSLIQKKFKEIMKASNASI